MTNNQAFQAMLGWILAEIEKAKLPGQDPFILTSLTYCARQSVGAPMAAQLRPLLWESCKEMAKHTFDVFTPEDALGVIEWAMDREKVLV